MDDAAFEGNETFTVVITSSDGETTLDPSSGIVLIVDNDG